LGQKPFLAVERLLVLDQTRDGRCTGANPGRGRREQYGNIGEAKTA